MSRSASWATARVGMGWPKPGHGNHRGFSQEEKMQLILLPAQLPALPARQDPCPTGPEAETLEGSPLLSHC